MIISARNIAPGLLSRLVAGFALALMFLLLAGMGPQSFTYAGGVAGVAALGYTVRELTLAACKIIPHTAKYAIEALAWVAIVVMAGLYLGADTVISLLIGGITLGLYGTVASLAWFVRPHTIPPAATTALKSAPTSVLKWATAKTGALARYILMILTSLIVTFAGMEWATHNLEGMRAFSFIEFVIVFVATVPGNMLAYRFFCTPPSGPGRSSSSEAPEVARPSELYCQA